MGAGYRFVAKAAEKAAEIQIYEDVGAGWFGGVSAKDISSDLKAAGDVQRIDVRIASYGGDVNDGLAIYRMLADHKARVVSHIDGIAASIASVIAMAGDEIVISEAGSVMIHDAWGMTVGNAADMRAYADNLERVTAQTAGIYAARTRNTMPQVQAWMAEEKWFYGQEAVTAGFAQSMVENVKAAASASLIWRSAMQSRMATTLHTARLDAGTAHPANSDVRAELAAQTARLRAKRDARIRGARA